MNINDIKNPDFLKDLNILELEALSQEIRDFIISNVSKTGGHVSSNLGIVELTIALHKVFDTPKDLLLFDVGHQCYTHKILTGRAKQFDTLRKYQGLSGFIKREESIYDVWEAGHAATSISAALGMAIARDHRQSGEKIIALIGDGSIGNGMAFEALNHAGELKKDLIVILNDNERSISENVGGLSKSLISLRYKKNYNSFKAVVRKFTTSIPIVGKSLYHMFSSFKRVLKSILPNTGSVFSELGFKYYGPIDGHNFKELTEILEFTKLLHEPVLIHVKTIKGKGYKFAEQDNNGKWHGLGSFDVSTGQAHKKNQEHFESWSNVISWTLEDLASTNKSIFAITPAMEKGSSLEKFREKYPTRFVDVGIAEEHAVTMAAGLASKGEKPFVSIYSTFLQRSYDQVLHDVCRPNLNVMFGIDRAGLVGDDGETHHGVFDVSFLTHLPNMVICMPKDTNQAQHLLNTCVKYDGPIAIRYPRGSAYFEKVNAYKEYEIGMWEYQNKTASNIVVITYGPHVIHLDQFFKDNEIDITVINAMFIKPLNTEFLDKIKDKQVYVYEEGMRNGSLYAMISDYYLGMNVDLYSFSIDDCFVYQGDVSLLLKEKQLDYQSILDTILTRR